MADNSQNLAYPLQFDPSQWANPYTAYNKMALPFMGQYAGTPTDAHGNPIQSYQDAAAARAAAPAPALGTTLNSSPSSGAQFPAGSPLDQMQKSGASPAQMQAAFSQMSPTINGQTNPNYAPSMMAMMGIGGGGGGAAAQPAAAQPAAPDMNAAYLAALANPGHVSTLGATVPQSAPPSNQSGVLQQFLQNWQNKGSPTTGAGNYNNQGFFNALQGQV